MEYEERERKKGMKAVDEQGCLYEGSVRTPLDDSLEMVIFIFKSTA